MQVTYIEDYPYAGMDFKNDEDLALPFGAGWDATCITLENDLLVNLRMFLFLKHLKIFGCTKGSHHFLYHVTDIGAVRAI